MKLKKIIIYIVTRLQFPPFKQLFALAYWLAIRVSIFCLKKVPGIRAVYVCGSFAKGEMIYGLSDIDLNVFLDGKYNQSIENNTKEILKRLKYIFPMMGPVSEQVIYFIDEFVRLYDNDFYLQHRLDGNFHKYKLLWGENVIEGFSFPPASECKTYLAYHRKLNWWMERILTLYNDTDFHIIRKRHMFFKALCDAGLIYLKLNKDGYSFENPEKTLRDLKAYVSDREYSLIEKILQEKKLLFRKDTLDMDDAFLLFKSLTQGVFKSIASRLEGRTLSLTLEGNLDEISPRTELKEYMDKLSRLCEDTENIEIKLFQFTQNMTNPHGYKHFDCPVYIIQTNQPLTLDILMKLSDFYKKELLDKARLLIKENEHYAYSVYAGQYGSWLDSRINNQILFLRPNEFSSRIVHSKYIELLKQSLLSDAAQTEAALEDVRINLLPPQAYLKWLFSSLQNLILYRSILLGQFLFLSTARAISSYLKENTPLSHGFVDSMLSEYTKSASSEESNYENIFHKSKMFLAAFISIVRNNSSLEELSFLNNVKDSKNVTISTIIITKSRDRYLKECLESLLRLERQPDEVIVVDNGSTDSTKDVVYSFKGNLPIRYIYTTADSIAEVRNAGIKIATKDIVAFIDDDAVADEKWLTYIEKVFLKDPEIAIAGGSIYNIESTRKDLAYRYVDIISKLVDTNSEL